MRSVLQWILGLGLVTVMACSGGSPYTWGDASARLAADFCGAVAACGYTDDEAQCAEHTSWHLCETDYSCDVEIDEDGATAALEACAAALEDVDSEECYWLGYWGVLPPECSPVWDYNPGPQS